jgi:hypothetical protein
MLCVVHYKQEYSSYSETDPVTVQADNEIHRIYEAGLYIHPYRGSILWSARPLLPATDVILWYVLLKEMTACDNESLTLKDTGMMPTSGLIYLYK